MSSTTGPTAFLVKGKGVQAEFSTAYLEKFGAAKGSMIIANKNTYMDTETWEEMTPSIICGYCNMSTHTKSMPEWWIFEIVDGFGAHTASYKAMEMRYNAKIIMGKEEGDTSHFCQAYDQQVAKSDKRSSHEAITVLKNMSFQYTGKIMDQYGLVQACLYAIRACTKNTWIQSFRKVCVVL